MNSKLRSLRLAISFCATVVAAGPAAYADSYAYMGTGNAAYNFGVLDLSTGVFSLCGSMENELSGIGVGPDHQLYGGAFLGSQFFRIDLTNGSLTTVGTSNISFFDTGSTTSQLYAVGSDSNLYEINVNSGAASLIGPLGLTLDVNSNWGMSTNSIYLYLTHNATLYKLDLMTGKARLVGTASQGSFLSEVTQRGILYAGSSNPLSIFALNARTGGSQFVANLTGAGVANPWGLAPIKEQSITLKNICKAHIIP